MAKTRKHNKRKPLRKYKKNSRVPKVQTRQLQLRARKLSRKKYRGGS
tara:strand:- start:242 stop:382 length:141 start_codon:yes stop_codon:yes gene_type:complete